MDASVLIVGSDDFLATVVDQLRSLPAFALETAPSPEEAAPLIQAQQPDLLVLQANQTNSLELCRQVKAQARLAWIYCIVLDCSVTAVALGSFPFLEAIADALEQGVDSYLPLPLRLEAEQARHYSRLLQAQIQVGLRSVRTHRELIRTNDLLSAIALSDPLTELNNRRALEWELPRQVQNARSREIPLSLVMLDVDFFKTINDTHGHLVGDRTLKLLSLRLRNNLRFYDTPFRYGGEEFLIILNNTDAMEAPAIARRICQFISNKPFSIETETEILELKVTVSAGVASLEPEDDGKGTSLLRRADYNLLKAKSGGRNRVVSGDETLSNSDDEG